MEKIKVGIVGLGRLGIEHAKNLAFRIPNAELIAICSIEEDQVKDLKEKWGLKYGYTDYEEMVKNSELDAVAIISPSPLHVNHIKLAYENNLHVFVEKPLGVNVEECKKAEKIVESNKDLVFSLGFMRRYDPSYAYAKEMIENDHIGEPFMIKATSLDPEHTIEGAIKFAATSGGLFLDMAVHDIDLVRWFLDDAEVSKIHAIGGSFVHDEFAKHGDGDNVASLVEFKENKMAILHSGRNAAHGYQVETEIIGPKGSIRIGSVPQKNLVEVLDNSGVVKKCSQGFQERFKEAYLLEMQDFIDCIQDRSKTPRSSVYDGTEVTRVAYAATEAFRDGKIVKL